MSKSTAIRHIAAYATSVNHRDELTQWLLPDPEFRRWIQTYTLRIPTQVHHILGRGRHIAYHAWCNLISVSAGSHAWAHDQSPAKLEIACHRAKMALEVDRIHAKKPIVDDQSRRLWHPELMAELIRRDSLAGRISELMARDGVSGTIFEKYGHELLSFLA